MKNEEQKHGGEAALLQQISELQGEVCAHLFSSQAFRNFIEELSRTPEKSNYELFTSTAEVIVDNTTAEGWALLLEAVALLDKAFSSDAEDHQWLQLIILNIQRCVKMYHELVEDEGTPRIDRTPDRT